MLAVVVAINEVGVPTGLPVEAVILLAGAFAVNSVPELLFAIALVTAADVLGGVALYFATRAGGSRLLNRLLRRLSGRSEDILERWRHRLGGRDVGVVFVGRSLPLVRMYISIGAGLLGVRPRQFLIGSIPGGLIWVGTPLVLGYAFRNSVEQVTTQYAQASHLAFLAMPLLSLALAAVWWVQRGASIWARIQRSRSAISLAVVAAVSAFLVRQVWLNSGTIAHGLDALVPQFGKAWPLLVVGLTAAILNLAITDIVRSVRATPTGHRTKALTYRLASELTTTVVWLALVVAVGALLLAAKPDFFSF